jgi:hypothetical protein
MRAIILAPGPSLSLYEGQTADLVIAVNRAALFWPCDCWAAWDQEMIATRSNYPEPAENAELRQAIGADVKCRGILLTSQKTLSAIQIRRITKPHWCKEVVTTDKMYGFCRVSPECKWDKKSALIALVYAAWKGATEIDTWGVDWSGTADADGVEAGQNRTTERWNHESAVWQALAAWMKPRMITRHTL